MPIGLTPAATLFIPSFVIAYASTVAVVVPSPATSLVFEATSFKSCAPMFSNGSSSSISRATDTPSFVTVGAPYFLSRRTSLPFGPNVVITAFEIFSTPLTRDFLASSLNCNCFAIIYLLISLRFQNQHVIKYLNSYLSARPKYVKTGQVIN